MIRLFRASLAAYGAFWDTLIPAASVSAARPAEDDARTDHAAPSVGHPTSAAPPAAEDDLAGFPPVPAGSPNFVQWALPIVEAVLSQHTPVPYLRGEVVCLECDDKAAGHEFYFADRQAFLDHVVPCVVGHLDAARRSSVRDEADQRVTRQLAAAGFNADVVEPPLWPFDAEDNRTKTCRYCREQIRCEDDSEPYHTATGQNRCAAPYNTYASPK